MTSLLDLRTNINVNQALIMLSLPQITANYMLSPEDLMKSRPYVALFFLRSPTLSTKRVRSVHHTNCIMHLLILSFLWFGLTLNVGKFIHIFFQWINFRIFHLLTLAHLCVFGYTIQFP